MITKINPKFSFLLLVVCLSSIAVSQSGPPDLPQEFEGEITINGNQAPQDRSFYIQVGNSESEKTSVNQDGGYEVLLEGENESSVAFYIENNAGERFEAVTTPSDVEFVSGGDTKEVNLSFTIEDPDPAVSTLEVEELGRNYSVLRSEISHVENGELYFMYGEESNVSDFNSSSIDVGSVNQSSKVYEREITGLEHDTDYDYKAVVKENGSEYKGSLKSFTTNRLPPFTVEGSLNLNDTTVEAVIDGEVVEDDFVSDENYYEIEIYDNSSFYDSNVSIKVDGKERVFEYESGKTVEANFEFEVDENESDADIQNNTDSEDQTTQVEDRQNEESNNQEGSDKQDSNGQSTEKETSSTESDEDNEDESSSQSVTGEFFANEVSGVTLMLSILLMITAGLLVREVRAYTKHS